MSRLSLGQFSIIVGVQENNHLPIDTCVKVFQRMKTLKNDLNVARAPKTDENHYYGVYYRFHLNHLLRLKILFKGLTVPR